jgi:hypothetical protein
MAKKKKRKAARKGSKLKEQVMREPKPAEPQFMVQVNDTRVVRKDILESLKEVILFMQGYEKFRKIQEEKILIINNLKMDVKELHNLIDTKFKKVLPKGKLEGINPQEPVKHKEVPVEHHSEVHAAVPSHVEVQHHPVSAPVVHKPSATSELDALESQLKEIENQLKGMD